MKKIIFPLVVLVAGIFLIIHFSPKTSQVDPGLVAQLNFDTMSPAEVEKFIKEEMFDVNEVDERGKSFFVRAVRQVSNPEMIEVLIRQGGKVNQKEADGDFPLYAALSNSNPQVAEVLLKHGAQVNQMVGGETLLMRAILLGADDKIEVLLNHGADVNARNKDRSTPLMYAAQYNQNPQMVDLLIERGASISAMNKNNATALMLAAFGNSNPQVIRTLVKHGAQVNARDKQGDTPLSYAARSLFPENAGVLIELGAKVNVQNQLGYTPLMEAAAFGKEPETIDTLIRRPSCGPRGIIPIRKLSSGCGRRGPT